VRRFRFIPFTLVAILLSALLGACAAPAPAASYTPSVRGAPSLQVDRELIDLGDQAVKTPVLAAFTLTNVGDQPLKFTAAPYIEVAAGC
jgi:hypothetical protein